MLIKHLRNRLLRCRKKLTGSESVQDLFPFWIYSYCRWTSTYQQWRVDIPLTSFTQSHCCSFQIQYLDFQHQMSYYFCIQWLFVVYLLTITVWFIFIMILFNECIYRFSSSLFIHPTSDQWRFFSISLVFCCLPSRNRNNSVVFMTRSSVQSSCG